MTSNAGLHSEPLKCFNFIERKLNQNQYFLNQIVPVRNKLLGYLGQYYYLKGRKVDSENSCKSHEVTFFLKIVPADGTRQRDFIEKSEVFNNEIAIYTLVFPKMLQFTDEFVPKYILDVKNTFLVLEDINSKGFKMINKYVTLKLQYCKSVLETVAKFHGKSILFEHRNQQSVLEFLKNKNIDLHSPDFLMQEAIITNIKGVSSIIDFIMDLDGGEVEGWVKVKKKIEAEAANYYKKLKATEEKKILCHSDLWSNNLLFKFDSDQNPIQCCLVDFQLSRYAPPAVDFLVFLQFTTNRQLRRENFQEFIKFYYNSLSATLKEEGLDVGNILSWNDFLKSIESLRFACMTAVLAYMSIDLLESDSAKEGAVSHEEVWDHLSRDTAPLVLKQFKTIAQYRDRIFDSLMELYELLADEKH